MKEHIYTIPINDAFDADCECPICRFMRAEENNLISYTLGASMMEPDERERSNASGFCKHHFSMLLEQSNKLSLALILESHLAELRSRIEADSKSVINYKKSLFNKESPIDKTVSEYEKVNNDCVICKKLDNIEEKFIDNLLELYKKEEGFRTKFKKSKGFCIPHFTMLVKGAPDVFSGDKLTAFYTVLYEIENFHLARIQEDITWFTKKFDFRYANEDWKNSRDAVPRTTEKIIGYVTDDAE